MKAGSATAKAECFPALPTDLENKMREAVRKVEKWKKKSGPNENQGKTGKSTDGS